MGFRNSVSVTGLSFGQKKKGPLIRRKGFIKPYRNFTKLLGELNKQLVGRALGTSHKNTQS